METPQPLSVSSSAFKPNGLIPQKYTCEGDDVIPPLTISGIPKKTKSLVLIMEDPDTPVGTWVHWVKYNIPGDVNVIEEGAEPPGNSGMGSGGNIMYEGPCPPYGSHRYFFKFYALDIDLKVSEIPPIKSDLDELMAGHVIAFGELIGRYAKGE